MRYSFLILVLLQLVQVCGQGGRPPIIPLRYLEDYSYLADSSRRTLPLDRLKYLPLGGGDSYLSLGANLRFGYERLADRKGADRTYYLLRSMVHADLHLGRRFRLFGQLASGRELSDIPIRPIDEDKAFFLNLFGDYQLARSEQGSLTLRLGRFEMNYGSGRLITMREGPTLRHSWDGARLRWVTGDWMVDALATEYVVNQPGYFDNAILDSGQGLWGVYATRRRDDLTLDAYYLGYRNPSRAFFNRDDPEDRRHTVGGRVSVTGTGWDFEAEGMLQRVTAGEDAGAKPSLAQGGAVNAGRTWTAEDWSVRAGLKLDYWSGDRDSLDGRIDNFNPMYVRQGYYQGAGAVFASNFYDFHPSVTLTYRQATSLVASVNWYWRSSLEDGLYVGGVGIPALPPRPGGSDRYLGRQVDLTFQHSLNRFLSLSVIYSHFQPGDFTEPNPTPMEINSFLNVLLGAAF